MRRRSGAFAFFSVCVLLCAPASADTPRGASMQFSLRADSASGCADKCKSLVAASGMIRPETPSDFEAFAAKNDIRGLTIVLESEGGSVLGAMALGRSIRRLGMTTTVGRFPDAAGKGARAALSPVADCESMCAFVLLSGIRRIVPPEARVRVHQIWLGDRREDATAAVYSAEDLVLVQRDIGKLAQYTFEMGGSAELLEVSLRIPPWEPMRPLSRDELRRMKLDTLDTAALPQPQASAASGASRPAGKKISLVSERGWILSEREGVLALSRRHPLTVEGEEIGSFDLSIACGTSPQSYTVTYNELRKSADGDEASARLKNVDIRIGSRSAPLAVTAQAAGNDGDLRDAVATGSVPAAWMKSFADGSSRSITVTASVANMRAAVIRIGNTGIAANFPQLAAACAANAQTTHAGLVHAE